MPEEKSMEEKIYDIIGEAIQAKCPDPVCPMCKSDEFTLLRGFIAHPIQDKLGKYNIGGRSIPVAMAVCDNCGFLAQHALGTLGVMNQLKALAEHSDDTNHA